MFNFVQVVNTPFSKRAMLLLSLLCGAAANYCTCGKYGACVRDSQTANQEQAPGTGGCGNSDGTCKENKSEGPGYQKYYTCDTAGGWSTCWGEGGETYCPCASKPYQSEFECKKVFSGHMAGDNKVNNCQWCDGEGGGCMAKGGSCPTPAPTPAPPAPTPAPPAPTPAPPAPTPAPRQWKEFQDRNTYTGHGSSIDIDTDANATVQASPAKCQQFCLDTEDSTGCNCVVYMSSTDPSDPKAYPKGKCWRRANCSSTGAGFEKYPYMNVYELQPEARQLEELRGPASRRMQAEARRMNAEDILIRYLEDVFSGKRNDSSTIYVNAADGLQYLDAEYRELDPWQQARDHSRVLNDNNLAEWRNDMYSRVLENLANANYENIQL
jgi:hypothetical protein